MKFNKYIVFSLTFLMLASCAPSGEETVEIEDNEAVVEVQNVESGEIYESVMAIGSIEAGSLLSVETQGSGTIEKLNVNVGDLVSKGDVLFSLDSENIENTYRVTESQLRTIRDNAKIALDDADEAYAKVQALYENGGATQSELDSAENILVQAKNKYNDTTVNYTNQRNNLKLDLEDREIKAPIDGKVSVIYIKEKETVGPKIALEIINESSMIFKTEVTGDVVGKLRKGTRVNVYPDGEKSENIAGEVLEFNQRADSNTGLFEVKIGLKENLNGIRTGEYAECEFIIDERTANLIPKKAVLGQQPQEYIYIVDGSNVSKLEVKTGIAFGDNVEIMSNIEDDVNIIVRGQNLIEEGDRVVIKK